MTTIQIKLDDAYVAHLLALISSHKEILIDDISIEAPVTLVIAKKSHRKSRLLHIAQECARLPTLDQ